MVGHWQFRIELNREVEALDRRVGIFQLKAKDAEAVVMDGLLRVEVYGVVQVLPSGCVVAGFEVGQSGIAVGNVQSFVQNQGLVEVLGGRFEVANFQIDQAEVVPGEGEAGVEFYGSAEAAEGAGQVEVEVFEAAIV